MSGATVRSQAPVNKRASLEDFKKRECATCAHSSVCVVIRAIGILIRDNFTEKTTPFQAGEIAKICIPYVHFSILALKGVEDNGS